MSERVRHCIDVRGGKTPAELRGEVMQLEATMRSMPQIDIPIEHFFAPGVYMRQMTMPKGSVVVGKIHKQEHHCILAKGSVSVVTDDGVKTFTAPAVVHAMPGAKRALHAHDEVVWINVHQNPDNERDLDKIESSFVVDTFEQFYLQSDRTLLDAIGLVGITEAQLTAISENESDQIPFHSDPVGMRIGASPLHGLGVFATQKIEKGEVIAPARIQGKRTPAGRYCNHGGTPNAEMRSLENGDVDLVALTAIEPGQEVLSDYYLNYVNTRSVTAQKEKSLCHL